jgi:hypothetical protein
VGVQVSLRRLDRFMTEPQRDQGAIDACLQEQRNVSPNTIASYRDTFRLLFTFAQARLRKPRRP